MRRILLGGMGLAFGLFARPAAAQYSPSVPTQTAPANRAARLGRPIATPDPAPSPVTPAGLVARGQVVEGYPSNFPGQPYPSPVLPPVGSQVPSSSTQYPVTSQVPGAQPQYPISTQPPVGPPPGLTGPSPGVPVYPLPSPKAWQAQGAPPTVTEIRGPMMGGPAGPGQPPSVPGAVVGIPLSGPVATPGVPVVPSVSPGDCVGGCAQPSVDTPLFTENPANPAPRFPAINRLLSCTNNRYWVSGEYLLWWTKSTQLPVLAATGPIPASPSSPVTTPTPILGGSFGQTLNSGARFGAGWWFSDEQVRGIDARLMFLAPNSSDFMATSAQYPVLGRPFYNINQPVGPLTDLISAPGVAAGGIAVHLKDSLWGAEANYRRYLLGNACARLDGLVGFRYLNFDESLSITETGMLTPSSPLMATGRAPFASATDLFRTTNDFFGGQIGLAGEVRNGRWFLNARGTVAFGTVFETADIAGGQTQVYANGARTLSQGGLLALPGTNIGHYSQDRFAVLPEIGLNLGYNITPNLRIFAGYNILYLSNMLRPAGVIDTTVDAARVPNFLTNPPPVLAGTPRPAPMFNTTDFWAQGINFGIQWNF